MYPIRSASLDALFYAFDLRFTKGLKKYAPWWSTVAQEVPSNTAANRYPWMADIGPLLPWISERTIESLALHDYELPNLDFEKTISVPRNAILDDYLGVYGDRIELLGYQASKWPDDLIATAMRNGGSTTTYDGQNFFGTAHPVNTNKGEYGTQANFFPNTPLTLDNYWNVRAAGRALKTEDNRPSGMLYNVLAVPPALERIGRQILETDMIIQAGAGSAAGAVAAPSNVARNTATLVVIDQLADMDTTWWLLSTDMPIRPFIFQNRQSPVFAQLAQPNDLNVFMRKEYLYGVDVRGNAGYGLWMMALEAQA